MKRFITHLSASVLLILGSHKALANTSWAIAPSWHHASDSDGLTIDKWFASALPRYHSGLVWQGFEWQQQRYEQQGESFNGHGLNYTAQTIDALSGMGYAYKLGVNQGPHATLLVGDVSWNHALTSQWQWGMFASRDWVESMPALRRDVHYDMVGASLDYQPHPRLTLTASLGQTHFSDDQDRQQQRARTVWDAWPEQGITLQWSYKHQLGEKYVTPRLYFNPERLDESMASIGWRRRLQGWQWYARLGRGQQQLDDRDTRSSTPARAAELQLNSPVHGASFFKLRTGQTETYGYLGPGYVYRYFDVQWIWQLGP